MNKTKPFTVGFYLYPDLQALDAVGPFEILSGANQILERNAYDVHLFSEEGQAVRTASGLELGPCKPIAQIDQMEPLDTFFVPGGTGTYAEYQKPAVLNLIQQQAQVNRRLCSVCSGSVFLAEAGLLNGKRASSHWAICDWMADTYPDVTVDKEAIFVRQG